MYQFDQQYQLYDNEETSIRNRGKRASYKVSIESLEYTLRLDFYFTTVV
jgi:hypothetical protein